MVKWSHRVKKTFKIRLKLNSNCIKLCMICFGNYLTSSMFCSLLGDDQIVQGCSKFQWNESETLWLYCLAAGLMKRPYLCPRTRWQRQSPSDHASRSVTSAVSLGASPMRGLSSLLGGWDVTTARRRLLLGSPWNEPRLAFISCLLATCTLRTEMQRWTVVCFRPNLWHLTRDENL